MIPQWLSSKESAYNAEAAGNSCLIPAWRRPPGGRHGNPLQYSCLENPMDRGGRQATVHRVTKSQTRVKQLNRCTHTHTHIYIHTHTHILYIYMCIFFIQSSVNGHLIFLKYLYISLSCEGLGYGMQHLQSSLHPVGSLAAACRI